MLSNFLWGVAALLAIADMGTVFVAALGPATASMSIQQSMGLLGWSVVLMLGVVVTWMLAHALEKE